MVEKPALASTAAAGQPAPTNAPVASGPTMKHTSSSTASRAKALCRSTGSGTRSDHSVRMHDDIAGKLAPDRAPIAASTAELAPSFAATTSATRAIGLRAAAGTSTAVCPKRSTSRPCTGSDTAAAIPTHASTTPATANEPGLVADQDDRRQR